MPDEKPIASPKLAIEARSLVKLYGGSPVVDGLSLQVEHGRIFGLLGPNAAGKTTTIRMLCGIIEKDAGQVYIDGWDIADARIRIGYVSQHFGQYEELTVWENLKFYAEMYGVKNNELLEHLLERYALAPFKSHRAGTLSGGYQRRLALVCAVAHDPDVLFLDEPTAGIDPVTRKLLWDEFYNLSAAGKTLFVTTHYMEEAQRCDQLAFIDEGRIIASGTPATIKQAIGDVAVYVVTLAFNLELQARLVADEGVLLLNRYGADLRIVTESDYPASRLQKIIGDIEGAQLPISASELNLEDVFIALTQKREAGS